MGLEVNDLKSVWVLQAKLWTYQCLPQDRVRHKGGQAWGRVSVQRVADPWAVSSIINVTWTHPIGEGRSLLLVAVGRALL